MVGAKPGSRNALVGIVDDLIDHHGPFGMEFRFSMTTNEDTEIQLGTKPMVVIEAPGQDLSPMYLRRPFASIADQEQVKLAIKQKIVTDLMEHLNLSGDKAAKIIENGGKGCKSINNLEDRARTALGAAVYLNVVSLIESPVRLEISRMRSHRMDRSNYTVLVTKFDSASAEESTD